MSLDDRTLAIYQALDSATLLALLPALRDEAARTKEEADSFERVHQAIPHQHSSAAEATADGPFSRERIPSSDGELTKVLDRLERHRVELVERDRWIRAELVRRHLLPEYPFWGERWPC